MKTICLLRAIFLVCVLSLLTFGGCTTNGTVTNNDSLPLKVLNPQEFTELFNGLVQGTYGGQEVKGPRPHDHTYVFDMSSPDSAKCVLTADDSLHKISIHVMRDRADMAIDNSGYLTWIAVDHPNPDGSGIFDPYYSKGDTSVTNGLARLTDNERKAKMQGFHKYANLAMEIIKNVEKGKSK